MGAAWFGALATGVVLAWASSATAAPVPVSSTLQLTASAAAAADSGFATDSDLDTQGATLGPLSVAVSATARDGSARVTTSGGATATFVDAGRGTVTFTRLGWSTSNAPRGSASLFGGVDWTYVFTAVEDGVFSVAWRLSTDPGTDAFGLGGFRFAGVGAGAEIEFGPQQTVVVGALTRSVVAGTTYAFTLDNVANIGNPGTRDAFLTGVFDWSVRSQVAEPATAGLLLAALAGLAAARRRRA
jgi:hypothetical protein